MRERYSVIVMGALVLLFFAFSIIYGDHLFLLTGYAVYEENSQDDFTYLNIEKDTYETFTGEDLIIRFETRDVNYCSYSVETFEGIKIVDDLELYLCDDVLLIFQSPGKYFVEVVAQDSFGNIVMDNTVVNVARGGLENE